jgi:hypothetical protein
VKGSSLQQRGPRVEKKDRPFIVAEVGMPATDYSKWDNLDVSDDEDTDTRPTQPTTSAGRGRPPAAVHDAAELVARMTKAERLGEEVLTERAQMVELDRRRNANREALGALRKADTGGTGQKNAGSSMKHWVCLGDVFMRQPHASARQMLEDDQKRIETELEALRLSVKRKSSALCELDPSIADGSDVHRSFVNLHGVSAGELQGMLS